MSNTDPLSFLRWSSLWACTVVMCGGCVPKSLADAVVEHPDEFPEPYRAVVPPSADSVLGRKPIETPEQREKRRTVADPVTCFSMSKVERAPGLDLMRVQYSNTFDARAEVEAVVVDLGGQVDQSAKSKLVLQSISLENATPIPNPFECDMTDGQQFEVFTAQARAARATLTFTRDTGARASATIPVSTPGVAVKPSAGWSSSDGKSFVGTNIVLAALPRCWKIALDRSSENIGHDGLEGRAVPIRGLTTANLGLRVVAYKAAERQLVIKTNPEGIVTDTAAPAGVTGVCKIGQQKTLGLTDSCRFWVGNTVITVGWELVPAELEGVKDVQVNTAVHRAVPCEGG